MGGKITHAGFVSQVEHTAEEDALVVQTLKQAGAVIHFRTNQPQSFIVGRKESTALGFQC